MLILALDHKVSYVFPMIWAGQGVLYAEATAELTELAELIPAPVMSTLLGKSAFNERHPLSLGTGSYAATQMVRDYLTQSDALFAIGASLTRTLFAPPIPPGTRIVHATVDATDLNKDYVADVPLLGDAQLILRQLIEEIKSQRNGQVDERRRALIEEINSIREPWQQRWKTKRASAAAPINPYRLINDLMKTVDPANTIITHDSGNYWLFHFRILLAYQSSLPIFFFLEG